MWRAKMRRRDEAEAYYLDDYNIILILLDLWDRDESFCHRCRTGLFTRAIIRLSKRNE